MPSPAPTDRERLTAALHAYSLARRPVADDLVRADGMRFLVVHEMTDAWQGMSNRLAVRAFLGLPRASVRPMGPNKYRAALRLVAADLGEARLFARAETWRSTKVPLLRVLAVDPDPAEEWPALFQHLDAAEDLVEIDALCGEMGLDLSAPLPSEFLYPHVPLVVQVDDDAPRACRGAVSCARVLPPEDFRERRSACRDCGRRQARAWREANPEAAAEHTAAQRERYREAAFTREAQGRSTSVHPNEKRCDSCGHTYSAPVGGDFTRDRTRPDGLSRTCLSCSARASDRRRHPTSN